MYDESMVINPIAKTILCYGDSNTWGQKPGHSGRYPADTRWTGVLQNALGTDFYVIEEGLGGRTTDVDYTNRPGRNGKTYLGPCLESHEPINMVIVMLGTNDLKIEFRRTARDIASALQGLIELIQQKTSSEGWPTAKVMVVSPILINNSATRFLEFYQNHFDDESVRQSQQLAGELQKVANQLGCVFVDAAKVAHAGDDGVHFTQASHQALGTLLAHQVQSVL